MQILDYKTTKFILSKLNLSVVFAAEEISESKLYDAIIFSVFDHWLSEIEADEKIISYNKKFLTKKSEKSNMYFQYEKNFISFYSALYEKYSLYILLKGFDGGTLICKPDNKDEYLNIVKSSVREEQMFSFLIPELKSVFSTSYDFTHFLYTNRGNNKILDQSGVFRMIQSSNLFILN